MSAEPPSGSFARFRSCSPPQAFRSRGRFVVVRDEDVRWLEAQGRSTRIHTATEAIEVNYGLSETIESFRSGQVVRVHRSCAVHLQRVVEMEPEAHGDWWLLLDDGTRLRLSRTYRRAVVERLAFPAGAVGGRPPQSSSAAT